MPFPADRVTRGRRCQLSTMLLPSQRRPERAGRARLPAWRFDRTAMPSSLHPTDALPWDQLLLPAAVSTPLVDEMNASHHLARFGLLF